MKSAVKHNANRYNWIDYARGIAIILVVYRHSFEGIKRAGFSTANYHFLEYANIIFFSFRMPLFFIVSGIFIYCAGNFFLFIMFNYLTLNYNNFAFYSWYINDVLILIMNIFFAKGIQCSWK